MEIAVWDSVKPRPGTSHADLYREHLAEIAVAEECGFQHYWFLEHHLTPSCPLPRPTCSSPPRPSTPTAFASATW